MAIFKKPFYYDNSIVYMDTAWSADADPEINVRFAHGRFNMDYQCPRSAFVNDFKKDFTAFYEKVMKDYDEVTGKSNSFEDCFDALLDDMTETNYRPVCEFKIDFNIPDPAITTRQMMYDEFTKRYFWCDSTKVEKLLDEAIKKSIVEDE